MQWSEGKVWQLLQCMVQWEVSQGKGWWGHVQASLHSLQAGFKLKLSIKQPKQKIFRTKQYSLHSWSRIALCTFLHYPETQFHFCHYRDCVRDAIKRENINMDEVSNSQVPTFFWQDYSLSGRQACVGNSRGEAGDARGNPKGGEELAVQTSPFSPTPICGWPEI